MDYSPLDKESSHFSPTLAVWGAGIFLLAINYILFIHLPDSMNHLYDIYDLDFYERVLSMFAVLFSIWLIIQSIKWRVRNTISNPSLAGLIFSAVMLILIPYQLYHARQKLCSMECGPYPPAPSLKSHIQPD